MPIISSSLIVNMKNNPGRIISSLVLALLAFPCHAQSSVTPAQPLMISAERFTVLRQEPARWAALRKRCDKELTQPTHAVADYSPARHYTADGVSHDPSGKYLNTDAGVAYRAALCYQLSHDNVYARHTQQIADAWGKTLTHASKDQGAAELNFNIPQLVIAASWVRDASPWDDSAFISMLQKVALPLSHADKANNHGNWGVLMDASIAAYTGNNKQLERAQQRWQTLLLNQVAEDGSMPLEICRSNTNNFCGGPDKGINGISYTHYTLHPATITAEIFMQLGKNLYQTDAGKKLSLAYQRVAQWTRYPERFPYYASNQGKLNGINNTAYFLILQAHTMNDDAAEVIKQGKPGSNSMELVLLYGQ
ncbi:alginate lyase family protein [Undibacterium sp. TC9W]|uniref:alginate lyase family protein n=1 Tax=Undibacterium sp. TC9W TaxID=3413053 RepID=UPI003BF2E5AB